MLIFTRTCTSNKKKARIIIFNQKRQEIVQELYMIMHQLFTQGDIFLNSEFPHLQGHISAIQSKVTILCKWSGSCRVIVRQSSCSHQEGIRQSSGSQTVTRQFSNCQISVKFVIYCAAYGAERLISLVLIVYIYNIFILIC